jgi:hypothetical protein
MVRMSAATKRHTLTINRAPVLTLWAAVVAERLGFDRETALTLGKVMAGLNAAGKGRAIGVYRLKTAAEKKAAEKKRAARNTKDVKVVDLLEKPIPVTRTPQGLRAVQHDKPVDPKSVERYLESKFGDALSDARAAMTKLARAHEAHDLAAKAFVLYEEFRPTIPSGLKGWGAAGVLDLDQIRKMAKGS